MEKKKKVKKIFISAIILVLMIGISTATNATEIKTSLNVIQKASETTYLENRQGYLTSEITTCDSQTGELTLQTTLNNTKKSENSEETVYDNTEIYIIVSENLALEKNAKKLNEYATYIETLSTKILENNSKAKIGIIGMKGTVLDVIENEDGSRTYGENDEGEIEGTKQNAEIIVNLTDKISDLKNGLINMNSHKTSYRENPQATIRLAKNSYSSNTNKILILMYDDVPVIAIGECSTFRYGDGTPYSTVEEAGNAHLQRVVDKTKSEILSLKNANIDFILLKPKDTSFDKKAYDSETGKLSVTIDGSPYVKELYGTLENPTYGKMYSLDNNTLEKIVTEHMYKDIMEESGNNLSTIEIKNYFSKEILNYFEITVLNEDNTNIDTSKLNTEGYIKWDISKLENGEKATLKYALKLKDMKNKNLLNKTIATNEKLEIAYINYLKERKNLTLTSSPKIQLSEVKEEEKKPNITTNNQEEKIDKTIATGTIPQTGINIIIAIIPIVVILILIIIYKKYNSYKDVK